MLSCTQDVKPVSDACQSRQIRLGYLTRRGISHSCRGISQRYPPCRAITQRWRGMTFRSIKSARLEQGRPSHRKGAWLTSRMRSVLADREVAGCASEPLAPLGQKWTTSGPWTVSTAMLPKRGNPEDRQIKRLPIWSSVQLLGEVLVVKLSELQRIKTGKSIIRLSAGF